MAGSDDVVARLAVQRGRELVGYAYLLTWDLAAAQDLVQDALVRTVARARRGMDLWAAEAYVRRTVLNLFLDHTRRDARWRRVRHLVATEDTVPPGATTPEQLEVRAALLELPPRERACVVLRYYEDMTVRQIAEQLGVSEGSVKRYLSTGVRRLGHLLEPEPGGEEGEVTVAPRKGQP